MRLKGWLLYVLLSVTLMAAHGARAATEPESPTQLVQRLIQAIGHMKATNNGHLSATEQVQNDQAARVANTILDIPGVSQWALGKHWEERSTSEQQEFITLLEELFAKVAYPKSAEFFSDLKVDFAGERVSGQQAVVRTTVTHTKEGLVSIDYRLIHYSQGWRVRDILLDDVSLAMNLRSQFNKIITEHSYAELLRRIREKLAESS
jgi:ABC-type transporter MlaC component